MPAIDFPNSTSVNDKPKVGDRQWKWNGSQWKVVRSVSSGGRTLIESKSLTGASVAFTSISGQYTDLYLVVEGPTADVDETQLCINVNNNSSSVYRYAFDLNNKFSICSFSTDSTETLSNIRFSDYASSNYKFVDWNFITMDDDPNGSRPYYVEDWSGGGVLSTTAITSIQLSTGTSYDYELEEDVDEGAEFTGGTAYLYGVSL